MHNVCNVHNLLNMHNVPAILGGECRTPGKWMALQSVVAAHTLHCWSMCSYMELLTNVAIHALLPLHAYILTIQAEFQTRKTMVNAHILLSGSLFSVGLLASPDRVRGQVNRRTCHWMTFDLGWVVRWFCRDETMCSPGILNPLLPLSCSIKLDFAQNACFFPIINGALVMNL